MIDILRNINFSGNLVKSEEKGVRGVEMLENGYLRKVLVFSAKRIDFSYIMQTSEKIKFWDFSKKWVQFRYVEEIC